MRPTKVLEYTIPAERYALLGGDEHGAPSAKIIIEFPQIVEDLPAFRASLESIFVEILTQLKAP